MICMGLVIPHLPIDTFNDDDDLWITANCKATLQMAPGNRSYPEIVTFKQVVLANENWNALLELHIEYWMNGTMLQSCLDCLLFKREASAVEFIMSVIDPTTSSRIEKAQSNLPILQEAAQKLGTNTEVPAPLLSACKQWNNVSATSMRPCSRQSESKRRDSTK
jgi:hypothetical protein